MVALWHVPKKMLAPRRYLSRDHRVIGKQYFFLSLGAALAGILLSLLMIFSGVVTPRLIL